MSELPKRFIERYEKIVDQPQEFFQALKTMPPKSFRVNTLKAKKESVVERFRNYGFEVNNVPFSDIAFTTSSLQIGQTLEHFLGHIYIQELSSMLPPLIAQRELENATFVLDACAAPGSKTTQIAAIMKNQGTLVANDNNFDRIRALKFNLEKTGSLNTMITNQDFRFFTDTLLKFDVVFVDAPCSAEGTIRRSDGMLKLWNENHINSLANLQKQLIKKAFEMVRPGGVLVYSTCTYAPEENEGVLDHLLAENTNASINKISLHRLRHSSGMETWQSKTYDSQVKNAIRVWPHQNNTEGFFVAKVMKNE